MRDVKIKKVLNGFRVKIGCQEVVFTKKEKLLNELSRYIDNPDGVAKQYLERYKRDSVDPSDTIVELSNESCYGNVGFMYGDVK